ncbi:MAG: cyclopropane-fatty-acyl-phospholipid synthase [Flavobacteriaceae bacterium]|jgi:cyclopropane-fatty-acyl-phospholipid synthase
MQGLWSCESLTELVQILIRNRKVLDGMGRNAFKKWAYKFLHVLNRDTELGARKNIAAHYDLGNDLFKTFLDPTMTYSSGFFASQADSMETASIAKLDMICKKLKLSASDQVIEIGAGWGSFALHAARNYGCHVTTTTISQAQYDLAKSRIERAGLEGNITLLLKDYRDLKGTFDKLVSIEMIEAVGLEFLGDYFSKCADLLKPSGNMLIQAITIADQQFEFSRKNVDFIQRYIFPGGALPSVTALTATATEHTDLRLFALEDITAHYGMTVNRWREQFSQNIERIKNLGYDNQFLRMWEYYLCYCEGGFNERAIGCVHAEFHKPLFSQPLGVEPLSGESSADSVNKLIDNSVDETRLGSDLPQNGAFQ